MIDYTLIGSRIRLFRKRRGYTQEKLALTIATSAMQAVTMVGMPEARIILAEATVYVATSKKSNGIIFAAIAGAIGAAAAALFINKKRKGK